MKVEKNGGNSSIVEKSKGKAINQQSQNSNLTWQIWVISREAFGKPKKGKETNCTVILSKTVLDSLNLTQSNYFQTKIEKLKFT